MFTQTWITTGFTPYESRPDLQITDRTVTHCLPEDVAWTLSLAVTEARNLGSQNVVHLTTFEAILFKSCVRLRCYAITAKAEIFMYSN
jgi:hypothetical protein